MNNIIRSKIFFGTARDTADKKLNNWLEENVGQIRKIEKITYQHVAFGEHSILIVYEVF